MSCCLLGDRNTSGIGGTLGILGVLAGLLSVGMFPVSLGLVDG
jgi:hypothetical protein